MQRFRTHKDCTASPILDKVKANFIIPNAIYQDLKHIAILENTTAGEIVRDLIADFVVNYKTKQNKNVDS